MVDHLVDGVNVELVRAIALDVSRRARQPSELGFVIGRHEYPSNAPPPRAVHAALRHQEQRTEHCWLLERGAQRTDVANGEMKRPFRLVARLSRVELISATWK